MGWHHRRPDDFAGSHRGAEGPELQTRHARPKLGHGRGGPRRRRVVVAVSPSEVEVGEPVEVLLGRFVPIEREGALPQSSVREPHPAPSGFWNVLMPWDDYPFDVDAQHDGAADVAVQLARNPSDATLWRGSVSLPSAGTWTIWVRNFPGKEPGSTTTVTVRPGGSAATASPPPDATTTGQASIDARPVALIAALVGLVVGVLAALAWRRRPAS